MADYGALLGLGIEEEPDAEMLAKRLRSRGDAADLFSMSTLQPLAQGAQSERQYVQDDAETVGALRKSMAAAAAAKAEADRQMAFDREKFDYEKLNDAADRESDLNKARLAAGGADLTQGQMVQLGRNEQYRTGLAGMKEVMEEGYDAGSLRSGWDKFATGGEYTNKLASEAGQKYQASASRVKEAALRTATGAAAPQGENAEYIATLIPRFGDSEATIQYKMKVLDDYQRTLDSMLARNPDMTDKESKLAWEQLTREMRASMPDIEAAAEEYALSGAADEAASGGSMVSTQAEYDALPSGAMYVEPDGKRYRKP